VYALTGGFFANWMPPDHVEVGDYGVIARERFVRDGNLRSWKLNYEIEVPEKAAGKLEYSDRAKVSAGLGAKAGKKVSAKLSFHGKGAFVYHLSGITTRRLKNSRAFFEDLARKWLAGEISLEADSVIVNEVRLADKATIIVSEADEGSLELQGDLSFAGQAILADVRGGLHVANSYGSLLQWLAADGTIPIISLVRPIMGPPGGPPPTSMVQRVAREIQKMFRDNKWDVRLIDLRNYVESPQGTTVTAKLPDGHDLSIGFHPIDAAEFLARSESAGKQRSVMEENVKTLSVGQGRAMRSAG
jgi:hypothetical protein